MTLQKHIKSQAILLLIFILFGCSAQKKINRLIDKYPDLTYDTIHHADTFIIDRISYDTSYALTLDTVVIEKDRLRIKTVVRNDSIFIQGEVIADTIIKEVRIPYEKVVIQELTLWQKHRIWLIPLLIASLYIYLRKKIPFLP